MSFQTGLSGLDASSQMLSVIGNNIANANTVGMKESRVEFGDLVASAIGSDGSNGAGIGVNTEAISQQFTQGNITVTSNNLDLAINGNGFFQLTLPDGALAYTRDGQFQLDKNGNIVTATGANVMGYPTDVNGTPTSITPQPLTVPTTAPIAAQATANITVGLNLDSGTPIASTQTPPTPIATYGTSVTTYDSQGNAVPLQLYFTKIDPTNAAQSPIGVTTPATDQWAIYNSTTATTPIGYMSFGANGALVNTYDATGAVTATPGQLPITMANTANTTAGPYSPTLNLSAVTEYGTTFQVANLSQDGYTSGEFTNLAISTSGVITTTYSNGQTLKTGGMIAIANFRNVQGLTDVGSGEYLESYASGAVVLGDPSIGQAGAIQAGAVENSNVNVTSELVNMMTAQQAYQANAQTIKTEDTIMQTLVNLPT